MARLTFEELAALDVRLTTLFEEAKQLGSDEAEFCANAAWNGWGQWDERGFKHRMLDVVGWNRVGKFNELNSSDAYETVHDTLLYALPRCRGSCECSENTTKESTK
jgi:hypothetical protein